MQAIMGQLTLGFVRDAVCIACGIILANILLTLWRKLVK